MDRSKFTEFQLKQLDKAKQYWGTELEDLLHAIEETHEEKILKLLAKEYQRSQRAIKKQIEEIYFKLLESGNVTTTELYKYGRMKALSQNFNKELQRLGKSEYDLMKTELELAYQEAFGKLPEKFGLVDFAMPNKKAIERIVLTPWLNRTFSDSIWQNKTKMIRILERELLNCVSLGYSKDKAIQSIMAKTGACFSDAERLVRTELMHVLNDANDTVATESGYTHKQWLTAKDERVCPTCRALEDDVFPVEAQVYSHPRCRCTFIYLKNYSEKYDSKEEKSDIISDKKWLNANFHTKKKLDKHVKDHLADYKGYSEEDYVNRARELLAAPISKTIEGFVDKDGFIYKYDKNTDDFAVGHPGGSISTLYKPEKKYEYWEKERMKHEFK